MKYTRYVCLLLLNIAHYAPISAISMVYNFRIAQITKQPIFEPAPARNCSLIGLFFDQYRKKHTGIHQNFMGGLGSFIYKFESYYFRTDFAVSHIQETIHQVTTFSGTETDDILFTLGHNFIFNNRTVMTLSGLFGIPTHRIFRLKHTDFGYSQIGTGIQLDGLYALNQINTFLYGARYLYFVPRNACDIVHQEYKFTLGNIADILVAYKNTWNKHNGLELGYTARFRFGAHITPSVDDIVKKTNYIRSNFYGVYKYKFLIGNVANRFLFNISYGFDHTPKLFGNKYIVTVWTSWNISF